MFVYDPMTPLFYILHCLLGKNPNSLHLAYKTLDDQSECGLSPSHFLSLTFYTYIYAIYITYMYSTYTIYSHIHIPVHIVLYYICT